MNECINNYKTFCLFKCSFEHFFSANAKKQNNILYILHLILIKMKRQTQKAGQKAAFVYFFQHLLDSVFLMIFLQLQTCLHNLETPTQDLQNYLVTFHNVQIFGSGVFCADEKEEMNTKLARVQCFRVFCIVYIRICIWVCICICAHQKEQVDTKLARGQCLRVWRSRL